MSVALPSASGSASFARFTVNAIGAGVAIMLYNQYLAPSVINSGFDHFDIMGFSAFELGMGASALLGAMVANEVFNKVSGK
jgi:hypothetical protein